MSQTSCRCKGCDKVRPVSKFPTSRRLCDKCLSVAKHREYQQQKERLALL